MLKPTIKKYLQELDHWIHKTLPHYETLNPHKKKPTSWLALGELLWAEDEDETHQEQIILCGERILRGIWRNFPDNLFWDLDYLMGFLSRQTQVQVLEQTVDDIMALHEGYGLHSVIRFRYAHDFLYGFDWARWVRKAPEQRQNIAPFAPEFLSYLIKRQHELMALIGENDAKYHKLADTQFRNPFGFQREPAQERQLHQTLATMRFLPLAAWSLDGTPMIWDLDYSQMRRHQASELGMTCE